MDAQNRDHFTANATGAANQGIHQLPPWLLSDLRSDHAGETGAVMIYRGILAVSKDPQAISFARRHLDTEQTHLKIIEQILQRKDWTLLLPLWRVMGWLTGALPALFGPKAIYATIFAVESFVDVHYQEQLDRLSPQGRYAAIREQLLRCQQDERSHRDEANSLIKGKSGMMLRLWQTVVGSGSKIAVWLARRI